MNTLSPPALTGGGRMRGPAPEIAGGGLPRAFIVGSVILHVLAFVFALGVPRLLSSGASGNKVYVVDLVSLPGSPAAAPAPPAAAPPAPEPPKPPAEAPETKKPVIKEPPKKVVKPIVLPDKNLPKKPTKTPVKPPEKKAPEPEKKPAEPEKDATDESPDEAAAEEQAADAAPQTQTASTAPAKPGTIPGTVPGTGTGAGGPGGGSGTGGGDELSFYYALVKKRIETVWKRPVSTAREVRTAAVYIELSPTGRLLKLELKTPSGFAPFDRSIIQAVRDAEPFPPFPLALKMDRLTPTLEFELTPLSGDAPP